MPSSVVLVSTLMLLSLAPVLEPCCRSSNGTSKFISCAAHRYLLFFFQAEDGIRDDLVTGVQTCALPISEDRNIRMMICLVLLSPSRSSCEYFGLPTQRATW